MENGKSEKLRKNLAVAVRSIQWSYAIFWSFSTTEEGVLEWREGYYNGDIKTSKTVRSTELKAEKRGLKRSEQLRELYKSLSEGETEQQAARTSSSSSSAAALSPEDLTDEEWYYLVCMSFVFTLGQSLPGQALASGHTTWLCNAQHADSKVFSRSLLAKSASIQTVVCFPHLDGVIEIGVTDLVSEDHNLLQHIKASLLDFSKPVCTMKSSQPTADDYDADDDQMCTNVDREINDPLNLEKMSSPLEDIRYDHEDFNMDSPDKCSNGCDHDQETEDSFMLKGINGEASQVQSWHFMDDDFTNGAQHSMNLSGCVSEAFANQQKALSHPGDGNLNRQCLRELQKFNDMKLSSLDLGADGDLHYKKTVAAIFGGPSQLIEHSCSCNYDHESSFTTWKKGHDGNYRLRMPQKILKKILFSVPFMYKSSSLKSHRKDFGKGLENLHDDCTGRIKYTKPGESENFLALSSIVPSMSKTDKVVILNDTIKYLKELEERIQELESSKKSEKARKKCVEMVEQTSDNYDKNNYDKKKIDNGRYTCLHKRKACDIDETDPDPNALDLKVGIKDKEVQIDIRCPYKEYILLDIMDAINGLHLNSYSVQSSNLDGFFTLTLKSKFRGTAVASAGMIKQALSKVAAKC